MSNPKYFLVHILSLTIVTVKYRNYSSQQAKVDLILVWNFTCLHISSFWRATANNYKYPEFLLWNKRKRLKRYIEQYSENNFKCYLFFILLNPIPTPKYFIYPIYPMIYPQKISYLVIKFNLIVYPIYSFYLFIQFNLIMYPINSSYLFILFNLPIYPLQFSSIYLSNLS